MTYYVDTSALVKLVISEAETPALLAWLAAPDLGDDLEGVVTYDDRLADAARSYGMTTLAPR